eukprot:s72_g20.t1
MSAPIGHHDMGTLPAIAASATLPQKGDRIHAFWERQIHATVMLLVAKGHMKVDEVRRGTEYLDSGQFEWYRGSFYASVLLKFAELAEALGPDREDPVQRFSPGDVVRVRHASHATRWRRPHLRTPGFIHGVCGTVDRCVGSFDNPEQLAFGGRSWSKCPLYIVRFDAGSIQDFEAGERGKDQVTVDIYQSWLEPADAAALQQQQTKRSASTGPAGPGDAELHPDCKRARTENHAGHEGHDHVHEDGHFLLRDLCRHLRIPILPPSPERHTVEQRAIDEEVACPAIARALVSALLSKGVIAAEELRVGIEKVDAGEQQRGAVGRRELVQNVTQAANICTEEHHLIVCTLCSCYPLTLLGLSPDWYKSREYRSRAVREPRSVLKEFGTDIPADMQVVVHDSTADCRFLILPNRPKGTENWSEEKLQEIITRDSMIGVTRLPDAELGNFIAKYDLDGVDYNWEYPGYRFGQGYLSEEEVNADYKGLSKLVFSTRAMFAKHKWNSKVITMAYYPDGRQEQLLKEHRAPERRHGQSTTSIERPAAESWVVDLLHMMSYDQGGGHHSSTEYGKRSADQGKGILPPLQLTMGVPFYGRHSRTGEWTTYEDLVQKHWPLDPKVDSVAAAGQG